MSICAIHDIHGKKIEELKLPEAIFNGEINTTALHQAVVMYQANLRQGNASCKERGQVSGGGRKPWRQKGTGRARAGSSRSPLWKGGGVTFGP
ncbi:MAG: 50S ribosomal protein L4, partial [Candidatus Omnitrophica bacterium]|nr:50S ribosomal protein L4 [Candidatus Omnitrophota bacterium]